MNARTMMTGAAAAALLAGVALAQAPAPAPQPVVHVQPAMPQTRDEVNRMVDAMFARADSNRDGSVTKEERDAVRGARIEKRVEKRMGDPRAAFERLDSNRDGKLSFEEFEKGRELRIEKRVERRMEHGGAHHGRGHAYRGGHDGGRMGMMWGMADSNRDGAVSLAEARAVAMQHFDMVDTNRDGRIAPEERAAVHQRMRALHGQHQDAKPAS